MNGPSARRGQPVQTQPRLSKFTLRGLLTLPYRLCNPPPAVGKVRSFGLTPIFDVRLEDVLDRKHLPPLGLKDFEEWVLFVEQCPENLYFILWLREYTHKYDQWAAKVRAREAKAREKDAKRARRARRRGGSASNEDVAGPSGSAYRVTWTEHTAYSPSLALFFSRARETFFAPTSAYELVVPPELLSPFFVAHPYPYPSSASSPSTAFGTLPSPHPDPAVFAPLAAHVEARLRASLQRCVRAAYTNVGTFRATCGIVAGTTITLAGALPPLAVNFARAHARWGRLAALPALWLGLTIVVASLRGVCIMVYVFGDYRQLRRFELERPPPPPSLTDTAVSGAPSSAGYSAYGFAEKCGTLAPLPPAHCYPSRAPALPVAVQPVRPLTAPPKISIRIPQRPGAVHLSRSSASTPALTMGTTSVAGTDVHVATTTTGTGMTTGTGTGTGTTMSGETTLHTISISSSRKSGLAPADGDADADDTSSLAPSVPAYSSPSSSSCSDSDSGPRVHGVDASDSEDDSADDHGIYISPLMPPPEDAAEHDPAVFSAALALVAAAHHHHHANSHQSHSHSHHHHSGSAAAPDISIGIDVSDAHPAAPAQAHTSSGALSPVSALSATLPGGASPGPGTPTAGAGVSFVNSLPLPLAAHQGASASASGVPSPTTPLAPGTALSAFALPSSQPQPAPAPSKDAAHATAPFIPPFPYAAYSTPSVEDDSAAAGASTSASATAKPPASPLATRGPCWSVARRSRSSKSARAGPSRGARDLEAGGEAEADDEHEDENENEKANGSANANAGPSLPPAPALPLGPFDFDALPPVARDPHDHEHDHPDPDPYARDTVVKVRSGTTSWGGAGDAEKAAEARYAYAAEQPAPSRRRRRAGLRARLTTLLCPLRARFSRSGSLATAEAPPSTLATLLTTFAWSSRGAGAGWRARYARVQRTPAFGPVTRVLNPVVSRAQWEIVVRACALASVLSGVLAAALVALPVPT